MRLIFVHGWSVTNTNTYGDFPESLASQAASAGLDIEIAHIYLGKYISFHDEVTLDDIASAFDYALRELPSSAGTIEPFSCITHSTGGPVVRAWLDKYYGKQGDVANLAGIPLKHLVMLAPANHGSSLAVLGKQRVGRIKAWFSGVEPGQGVLDWLSLGSDGQWFLNEQALDYRYGESSFYPFVLTGQGIDSQFYDFLNGYLVEPGSDGVVRVAGASLNYRFLSLSQTDERIEKLAGKLYRIRPDATPVRKPEHVPMAVFSDFSHSGRTMGIMANKASSPNHLLIVDQVISCLQVDSDSDFQFRSQQMMHFTQAQQQKKPKGKTYHISRYAMLVIRVTDEQGKAINSHDYDILLLAGKAYKPGVLPEGFFVDRQMNNSSHSLVYYLDAEKMLQIKDNCFGLQVNPRPDSGFSYYRAGQFRSEGLPIEEVCAPNQTTYIDITLKRQVDKNVFRFASAEAPRESFAKIKPSGDGVS